MLRDCGRALSQMLGTGTCCRGRGQAGAASCFGITWTAGLTHFTGPRPVRARVVTCYGVVDEVCHSCPGWAFVAGLGVGPGQSQARAASCFGISWTTGLSHVTGPRPARAGAVTLRGCGRVLSRMPGAVAACRAWVVTCHGARPGPDRGASRFRMAWTTELSHITGLRRHEPELSHVTGLWPDFVKDTWDGQLLQGLRCHMLRGQAGARQGLAGARPGRHRILE